MKRKTTDITNLSTTENSNNNSETNSNNNNNNNNETYLNTTQLNQQLNAANFQENFQKQIIHQLSQQRHFDLASATQLAAQIYSNLPNYSNLFSINTPLLTPISANSNEEANVLGLQNQFNGNFLQFNQLNRTESKTTDHLHRNLSCSPVPKQKSKSQSPSPNPLSKSFPSYSTLNQLNNDHASSQQKAQPLVFTFHPTLPSNSSIGTSRDLEI